MSPVIPVLEDHNLAESEKILLSRSMSASKRLNKSSSIGSMMTLTDLAPSDIDEEEYSQTSDVIAGTEEVEHNKPPSPETAPEPHKHFPLIGSDT